MKNMIRIVGVLGTMFITGLTSNLSAQQSNVIKEVSLNGNDSFNELRKLVMENFDFTKPTFTEGEIDSVVKFQISEDGKISKVKVNGDCKYVSQELKDVMNSLVYKFDKRENLSQTYVMPIHVSIASR